jgi:hypothetical protein
MRTLKLTHEEVELIQRALGIAESEFNKKRKAYIADLINVRGVSGLTQKAKEETDFMLEIENKFCDLNIDIENSKKDV